MKSVAMPPLPIFSLCLGLFVMPDGMIVPNELDVFNLLGRLGRCVLENCQLDPRPISFGGIFTGALIVGLGKDFEPTNPLDSLSLERLCCTRISMHRIEYALEQEHHYLRLKPNVSPDCIFVPHLAFAWHLHFLRALDCILAGRDSSSLRGQRTKALRFQTGHLIERIVHGHRCFGYWGHYAMINSSAGLICLSRYPAQDGTDNLEKLLLA